MMGARVLVVGQGGREHALAWKLAQSPLVERVFVAPGNAGTATEHKVENVAIAPTDGATLLDFARAHEIALTVVGPEQPLAGGLVDQFRDAGQAIFGPTQAAAELEWSKAYCKDFLQRHAIPTADYAVFTALEPALDYVRAHGAPIVIKADGLAAGKGVVVATTEAMAVDALQQILGSGPGRVVIEAFLDGEEASYIVVVGQAGMQSLASSQDHKRLGDGDAGPNTGGMGAYSPAPVISADVEAKILAQIIEPTLAGMHAEGRPFTGFLYAGVMIDRAGQPRLLEYNCRMGDPETQPLMARLQSDLFVLLQAAATNLPLPVPQWDTRCSIGVVLAAHGYPAAVRKGDRIGGLDQISSACKVFHAGTRVQDGSVLTDGGRVLCVVALGDNLPAAQSAVYHGIEALHFDGMQFRRDIAWRALRAPES